jgi:iron(III) transport system substrate-binding protein
LDSYRPKTAAELASEFRGRRDLWHGFACRARVIICNRKLVKPEELPKSIFDLSDPRWKGRAAMAYPLFGTTATHCAALRAEFGRAKTNDFLKALVANGIKVVNGNGIVAEMVGSGSAALGLTDTDDAWAQIDAKKPVGIIYPDQGEGQLGTLIIPNTAGRVAGGPHPEAAARFLDFLCSAEAEAVLALPSARHLPTRLSVKAAPDATSLWEIRAMKVDWERVADEVERQSEDLERIFPR